MKKFCLVTPTHKASINEVENLMLKSSLNLHKNTDHFFCVPDNIPLIFFRRNYPKSTIITISSTNFDSPQAYNRLLLSSRFYLMFARFAYLTVLQLDSVLLRNIEPIVDMNFDYVGAPWRKNIRVSVLNKKMHGNNKRLFWLPFRNVRVGNGGLSIRKIESMLQVTEKLKTVSFTNDALSGYQNEDFVISYMCRKLKMKIPNHLLAERVFVEEYISTKSHELEPYGYHALEKFNHQKYLELVRELRKN